MSAKGMGMSRKRVSIVGAIITAVITLFTIGMGAIPANANTGGNQGTTIVTWQLPAGHAPASSCQNGQWTTATCVTSADYPQILVNDVSQASCNSWLQQDKYPSSKVAQLTQDGKLTYQEDWGISQSWKFVYTGACTPPPPVITTVDDTVASSAAVCTNVDTNPGDVTPNSLTISADSGVTLQLKHQDGSLTDVSAGTITGDQLNNVVAVVGTTSGNNQFPDGSQSKTTPVSFTDASTLNCLPSAPTPTTRTVPHQENVCVNSVGGVNTWTTTYTSNPVWNADTHQYDMVEGSGVDSAKVYTVDTTAQSVAAGCLAIHVPNPPQKTCTVEIPTKDGYGTYVASTDMGGNTEVIYTTNKGVVIPLGDNQYTTTMTWRFPAGSGYCPPTQPTTPPAPVVHQQQPPTVSTVAELAHTGSDVTGATTAGWVAGGVILLGGAGLGIAGYRRRKTMIADSSGK